MSSTEPCGGGAGAGVAVNQAQSDALGEGRETVERFVVGCACLRQGDTCAVMLL